METEEVLNALANLHRKLHDRILEINKSNEDIGVVRKEQDRLIGEARAIVQTVQVIRRLGL